MNVALFVLACYRCAQVNAGQVGCVLVGVVMSFVPSWINRLLAR
jgi:hypothetical protein